MDEMDLEGLELVSAAFFTRQKGPAATIKNDGITFNSDCLCELENTVYIRIIMDKINKTLYIMSCQEDDSDALRWCNVNGEKRRPRKLSGKGFADLLFALMNWDVRNRYIVNGERKELRGHDVFAFDLNEAENEMDFRINRIVELLKNVEGVVIPDLQK